MSSLSFFPPLRFPFVFLYSGVLTVPITRRYIVGGFNSRAPLTIFYTFLPVESCLCDHRPVPCSTGATASIPMACIYAFLMI
jgi:hypothetical protein